MADQNTIPENYTPLSPDQKSQWNDFATYLMQKTHPESLDENPGLGAAYMQHYSSQNPSFSLTPDHIPHIQYEQQQIRSGDNTLSGLGNPSFYARKTSEPNGHINSLTATSFYPTFVTRNAKSKILTDYGTDADKFVAENPSAIKGTDKNKDAPAGAAVNPTDKDAQQWLESYIASPKYKERLNNFWQNPSYVQQSRENQLKNVKFSETSGTKLVDGQVVRNGATIYDSSSNSMNVNTDQLKQLKSSRGEADVHELAHGQNAGDYKSLELNPVEQNYIFQKEAQVTPDDKKYYPQYVDQYGGTISDQLKGSPGTHDLAPSENLSDIQALRYMAFKKGLYDARTQDLTPEVLQKIKADPDIKNSFTGQRVFSNFKDEDLLDIMNKVAFENKAPAADANIA